MPDQTQTPAVSPPTPEEHQAMLEQAFDSDPELHQQLHEAVSPSEFTGQQATEGFTGAKAEQPSGWSQLWDHLKTNLSDATGVSEVQGAVKGAVKAVGNIASAAVHGAAYVANKTGMAAVDTDITKPEQGDAAKEKFADWYSKAFDGQQKPYVEVMGQKVPIVVDDPTVDSWFGANMGHLGGLVEGLSQFTTSSFLLAPEAGGPVDTAFKKGADIVAGIHPALQTGLIAAVEQGPAAALGFDPSAPRISNMLRGAPAWLGGPIWDWLSAKPGDTGALARVKSVLEFTMSSVALHGVLKGLNAAFFKDAPEALAGEPQKLLPEGQKALPAGDVVTIAPNPEGHYDIKPATGEGPVVTAETKPQAEMIAASFNQAAQNEKLPVGKTDATFQKAWDDLLETPELMEDPKKAADFLESKGVRLNYAQTPEQVQAQAESLANQMMRHPTTYEKQTLPWKVQRQQAAKQFGGMTAQDTLEAADPAQHAIDRAPALLRAFRVQQELVGRTFSKWALLADSDPTNAKAVEELGRSGDTLLALSVKEQRLASGLGRGLQATQDTGAVASLVGKFERASRVTKAATKNASAGMASYPPWRAMPGEETPQVFSALSRDEIRSMARVASVAENPGQSLSAIMGNQALTAAVETKDPLLKTRFGSIAKAYRLNSLLSGPPTLVAKVTSDIMTMAARPPEYFWAGLAMDKPELMEKGKQIASGLLDWENMRESFGAARKAFMTGEETLDPGAPTADGGYQMRPLPQNFPAPDSMGGKDWLNTMVNAPSRFLMTTTDFAKQMNYRAMTRAMLMQRIQQAGIEDPKQVSQLLQMGMSKAFSPEGLPTLDSALEYARKNTFVNQVTEPLGAALSELANKIPLIDALVPFRRVPTNLFNFAWERAPLISRLNADVRADIAAGGNREALARAKIQMGTTFFTAMMALAASGHIVGGGPANPGLYKQWSAIPGNQPYSVVFRDDQGNPSTSVSFKKAEPLGTWLMIAADLVQMSGEAHRSDYESLAASAVAAVVHTIASKNYLQDYTNLVDALHDNTGSKVKKLFEDTATGFVPNLLTRTNPDQTIHETRGLLDEFKSKLPGLSKTLPPRRNIFGEPVLRGPGPFESFNHAFNPFSVAFANKDNGLDRELLKVGKALPMPADTLFGGRLDLRSTEYSGPKQKAPYDFMMEQVANPDDGASLRDTLTELSQSDRWNQLPTTDAYGPGGLKYELVRKVVAAYHAKAFAQMLEEYPKLRDAWVNEKEAAAYGKAEGQDAADQVRGQ